MKKFLFVLMGTLVFSFVKTFAGEPYPLKDATSNIAKYIQSVKKDPKLQNDKAYYKDFQKRQAALNEALLGKTIKVEIKKGLGFELVSNEAQMGKGLEMMDRTTIPINVDLKVANADIAFKTGSLMVMMYDDKGAVVGVAFLEKEQSLTSFTMDDQLIEVSDGDATPKNPFTNGEVLKKGFRIEYHAFTAYRYSNITKVVITDSKSNNAWFQKIKKINDTIIANNRKTFKGFIK